MEARFPPTEYALQIYRKELASVDGLDLNTPFRRAVTRMWKDWTTIPRSGTAIDYLRSLLPPDYTVDEFRQAFNESGKIIDSGEMPFEYDDIEQSYRTQLERMPRDAFYDFIVAKITKYRSDLKTDISFDDAFEAAQMEWWNLIEHQ